MTEAEWRVSEAEWRACAEPWKMLRFLRGKASDRKLRLFACACCRAVWYLLLDERPRHAVEVAERFADGLATESELAAAHLAGNAAARSVQEVNGAPLRGAGQAFWSGTRFHRFISWVGIAPTRLSSCHEFFPEPCD
ncbi:MAG: hypothetical protein K8U57_01945 [Planctomycetes bacterium]|nr:hypothetical protein [Planctomycetota bacterium]